MAKNRAKMGPPTSRHAPANVVSAAAYTLAFNHFHHIPPAKTQAKTAPKAPQKYPKTLPKIETSLLLPPLPFWSARHPGDHRVQEFSGELPAAKRARGGRTEMLSMKWQALATDFDGTIATDGVVDEPTKNALLQFQSQGAKTLLVTGRELPEFQAMDIFLPMFDLVVAENGAVIYDPKTGKTKVLAAGPPKAFLEELTKRGVKPLSIGASIVATREPHEVEVLELIKEMGLEFQVIFNKGAVMILPTGVNKATGLAAALATVGIAPEHVIAVGDAENDHALLEMCGLPVAVANALPALKEKAAWTTPHSAGAGVVDLIEAVLRGELDSYSREGVPA